MSKQVFILIVIYNKRLAEAESISSLLDLKVEGLNIVIANNGPSLLSEDDDVFRKLEQKFSYVTLKNFPDNKPLSWVYNDFIDEYKCDRYVILDDDTTLTLEYFQSMVFSHDNYMIGLPKMISSYDHKQYTPFFNARFVNYSHGYISGELNFSITSAMVLSNRLVCMIKSRFGSVFDEHLALYGIDNALFLRIESIAKEGIEMISFISNVSLHHEFSNILAIKQPKWRIEEKLIADTVILRQYKRTHRQVVKQVLLRLKQFELRYCYIILKTYFKGRHPRCKKLR